MQQDLLRKEAAGEIEKQGIVWVNKAMISEGNVLDQAKKAAEGLLGGGGGGGGGGGSK